MAEKSPRVPDPKRELIAPEPALPAAPASLSAQAQQKERVWFAVLVFSALILGAGLLLLAPAGFWSKLSAIGYSVCHQIPERSFFAHEHQFPLCARCTGMYLGALLSLLFHFLRGRQREFPPPAVLLVLGLLFLAFALDGLNSSAQFFFPQSTLYRTTNLIRLITGFGAGICIGTVLGSLFTQSIWSDTEPGAALESFPRLLGLLGAAALLGWAVYSGPDWLKMPLAVLSALAVPTVLTLAYTVLAVMLLNRANQHKHWRELRVPLALGLCAALAQILLMDAVRLLLTGSWAAVNL
ncbi:MAG: DUF2085 domain-containing protein [Anaerolineaceae bacterium]